VTYIASKSRAVAMFVTSTYKICQFIHTPSSSLSSFAIISKAKYKFRAVAMLLHYIIPKNNVGKAAQSLKIC